MAIASLLSGASFHPEQIEIMAAAFERCLTLLDLKDRSDLLVEIIAKRIIELAQDGASDSGALVGQILLEFRAPVEPN